MANEINVNFSLQVQNPSSGSPAYTTAWSESLSLTQNAQGASAGIAATSTTMSNLDVGSVTTLGFLVLKNLDATNACDFGYNDSGTFRDFGTVKAGEVAFMRLKAGITPALKAAAGTPNIAYLLLQN